MVNKKFKIHQVIILVLFNNFNTTCLEKFLNLILITTIINKFQIDQFEIREINKKIWFLLSQRYSHPKNQILGQLYS